MKIDRLFVSAFVFLFYSLALAASFEAAFAATIRVPEDQPTIQAGVDAASEGDIILVAPGTYSENIQFATGKRLGILSSDGPETTIIDGEGGDALRMVVDPDGWVKIEGFTFINSNCAIFGVGTNGSYRIAGCILHDNNVAVLGARHTSFSIVNCLIYQNNYGYQQVYYGNSSSIINSTFADNTTDISYTPGYGTTSKLEVINSILRDQVEGCQDNRVYLNYCSYDATKAGAYVVAQDGCQNENPMFVDQANSNYRLQPGSPCVNAGDPNAFYNDADGTRNDMGYTGGAEITANRGHLDFGYCAVGQSKELELIIYNDKAEEIILTALYLGSPQLSTTAVFPLSVPARSNQTIPITYSPMSHGPFVSQVQIDSDALYGVNSATFPVMGNGVAYSDGLINVPSQAPSIQVAIDVCSSGDTILVAPGTYSENIQFATDKRLVILSSDGPEATIIDGGGGDAFHMGLGPGGLVEIRGFSIINSDRAIYGEGTNGSYRIAGCILHNNNVAVFGRLHASFNIVNCLIYQNNYGYQQAYYGNSSSIINSTFADNTTDISYTPGYGTTSRLEVINSILRDQVEGGENNRVYLNYCSYDATKAGACLVIQEGCQNENPMFVDQANSNYRLQSGSPCINAGDPNAFYNDADGTRNDMGFTGGSDLTANQGYFNFTYCAGGQSKKLDLVIYNDKADSIILTALYLGSPQLSTTARFPLSVPARSNQTIPITYSPTSQGPFESQVQVNCDSLHGATYAVFPLTGYGVQYSGGVVHVPSQAPTIQAGVDVCSSGDSVLVGPGTYYENIQFGSHERNIAILSSDGPDKTIIDGQSADAFSIGVGSGTLVELKGFSITNSDRAIYGGSDTNGSLRAADCILHNNTVAVLGVYHISIDIANCLIFQNRYGYQQSYYGNNSSVINSTFADNNTDIHYTPSYGTTSQLSIVNSILRGQLTGTQDNPVYLNYCNYDPTKLGINVIVQEGCQTEAPLFIDQVNSDYHLQAASPCIDVGTSVGAPDNDLEGNPRPQGAGYDIGAYERVSSSLPTAFTAPATSITSSSATLKGTVNPNGAPTAVAFEFGLDTNYGNKAPAVQSPLTGIAAQAVSVDIGSLMPGKTYHYRLEATNCKGISYSDDISFTTDATTPILTTNSISSITCNNAMSGGNITSDGGDAVIERGVCWSTSTNPTVDLPTKTNDGAGVGDFMSSITGLTANTTYYIRAFARNSEGIGYGNELTFTTLSAVPTVLTAEESEVTARSATGGGNVTSDGGSAITARGVCWSTSPNPTIADSKTTDGSGTGSFTSSLTGLTPNSPYYVRAYGTNAVGTAYGNEVSFTTLAAGTGSLTVIFLPEGAVAAGAKWRVDGGDWQASGLAVSDIEEGDHTLSFKDIDGWIPPSMRTVNVEGGQTTELSVVYTQETGSLPDTGQTKCYSDTEEIPCPQLGQDFYGQDGNYLINPPSYTKLDENGNDLPDDAAEWVMVRDNVTGLIWELKRNNDGVPNYDDPHDANNTYSWFDSDPGTNGGDPGTPGEGTDTEDFIAELNKATFGGCSDWRMPSLKELNRLTNLGKYAPVISGVYFSDTLRNYYWSSTTYASDTRNGWTVDFGSGSGGWSYKSSSYSVRAVRGEQSGSFANLVINGDGTVTDPDTGLMWQQNGPGTMALEEGLAYCEALSLSEHTDWRLPNLQELVSIVDYSKYAPAIDKLYFPDTASPHYSYYLSSSTVISDFSPGLGAAWAVDFHHGYHGSVHKINSHYIRAVRGGQHRFLGHLFISTPQQGSAWKIGDSIPISWETQDIAGGIQISISRQGGKDRTFETIEENTENDGICNWTVNGPVSANCMLKIEPLSDPEKGTTQGLFTIASTTLPTASISGVPESPTNLTGITLTVGGDSIISYKYKLDDGDFGSETLIANPIELTDLLGGEHTVQVLGRDAAGTWQVDPTTAAWTVDTVAPVATISGPPTSPTNQTAATLTVGGEGVTHYKYSLDGGVYGPETGVGQPIVLSGLSDAEHIVSVLGRDLAGNWQTDPTVATWIVDTVPPVAIINGAPTTPTSQTGATLTVSGDGVTHYIYRVDGGAYGAETTIESPIVVSGLSDGEHTVSVLGRDLAGNWQTDPTVATWTVDTVPPIVTGLSDDPTPTQSKTWTWGAGESATFRYAIDQSGAWTPVGEFSGETTATKTSATGTWYLHVQARDTAGNEGPVVTVAAEFIDQPEVSTHAATAITSDGATFNGTVDPSGDSTTVVFEYGRTMEYGNSVVAVQSPLSAFGEQAVSAQMTGLGPATTWHYRAAATNSVGTQYGGDVSFRTEAIPPVAATNPATDVGSFTAILNGTVTPNNLDTQVSFDWGLTEAYGSETGTQVLTSGTAQNVTIHLTGLMPGQTYHFRVKATNEEGTVYGADRRFFTLLADISVQKTVDNPNPEYDTDVTFSITATNRGPSDIAALAVRELLPSGLIYVSHGGQGLYDPVEGMWEVGPLNGASPANRASMTLTARVAQAGNILNIAGVAACDVADLDPSDNSSAIELGRAVQCDLGVFKAVDLETPLLGEDVQFLIVVTNNGPNAATGVRMAEFLPSRLIYVSGIPSRGTYDPATDIWDLGNLESGTYATLELTATVTSEEELVNTVRVAAADHPDPDTTNNASSVVLNPDTVAHPFLVDLSLQKSVNVGEATVGDERVFTVVVRNSGPDSAESVEIIDLLPAGLTFVRSAPSQGAYDSQTGIWQVGTIAAGAYAVMDIAAVVEIGETVTNTASIRSTVGYDVDTANDSASATVTGVSQFGPDIQANGSDGPLVVTDGTPVSITISLNPGEYAGFTADWWIAVHTPFVAPGNWYTYVHPTGWKPGVNLCAQAALFEVAPFEVLNMAFPVGSYTFYFAVDPPDGIPTAELVDSVVVNVE